MCITRWIDNEEVDEDDIKWLKEKYGNKRKGAVELHKQNVEFYIDAMNAKYKDDDRVRICDHCESIMRSGFVVNGGEQHYCSEKHLYKYFTKKEWEEMYDDGEGNSYWTTWED